MKDIFLFLLTILLCVFIVMSVKLLSENIELQAYKSNRMTYLQELSTLTKRCVNAKK